MATEATDTDTTTGMPGWVAPVVIVAIIAVLAVGSRKKDEVVENPVVELAILTTGVFAMGALLSVILYKLGSPGAAAFFGRGSYAPTDKDN